MNQEKLQNPDAENYTWKENEKKESQELSVKDKKSLADSWTTMVVDSEEEPGNITEMDDAGVKKWMYESLMDDTNRLIDEWRIKPDEELIAKIQDEEDLEKKAKYEIKYIESIHKKIQHVRDAFNNARKKEHVEKSNKWDSWPKKMREGKDFNCVGATLLGIIFLEKAGIECSYGSPSGHAVNIAKLSNGDMWYVDFNNDKSQTRQIDPIKTEEADGISVLKFVEPVNRYKIIPVLDNSEIPLFVLGNLSALNKEAQEKEIPATEEEKRDKEEAESTLSKFKNEYSNIDFGKISERLYPEYGEIGEGEEMKMENERVGFLDSFEAPIEEYTRSLSKKWVDDLVKEIKKLEEIEGFFSGDDRILSESSETLKNILYLYRKSLEKIKVQRPELYQEAVSMVVQRWENLGEKK